jgi:hypothetical protein
MIFTSIFATITFIQELKLAISLPSIAGQSRAEQGRAGQSRAEQGRAGQGRAEQGRAGQSRAELFLMVNLENCGKSFLCKNFIFTLLLSVLVLAIF